MKEKWLLDNNDKGGGAEKSHDGVVEDDLSRRKALTTDCYVRLELSLIHI